MPDEKKPEDLTPDEAAVLLEKTEEDEGSASEEGSPDGTTTQPPAVAESGEGAGAGGSKEDPAEKRIKDAQTKMHEKTTEAARLKEENRLLSEKLAVLEAPKPPQEMTQDQLDQLAIDDPKAYAEHLVAVEKYGVAKAAWDKDLKDRQDAADLEQTEAAKRSTLDEFIAFSSKLLGVKGEPGKPFEQQPKEIQDLYGTPEFIRARAYIEAHPETVRPDGSVSKVILRAVWDEVNPDWVPPGAAKAKAKADQLAAGRTGASALSDVGQSGTGSATTPLAKLSPAQIANLPPALAEQYLEQAEDDEE